MQRIQKIIANSGYTSRRKAEELIQKSKVKLNGKTAKLGDKATEEDAITIDNIPIKTQTEKQYYILNKPKGILVTKTDPKNRRTIYNLKTLKNFQHLNHVGRLDGASEGLIILTNDGELTNQLTHPKHHIKKTYQIRTEPIITKEDILKLKNGIPIDTRKFYAEIKPLTSKKIPNFSDKKSTSNIANKRIPNNTFDITIQEGRNRIIRKALEKLGYKIYQLRRIAIANIKLGNLKPGEIKEISKKDMKI